MKKEYAHRARGYLEKIRGSDESVKKKFLTITSIILAFFVVVVWIFYLNITISSIAQNTAAPPEKKVIAEEQKSPQNTSSFFKTFERGSYIIFQDIKEKTNKITEWITKKMSVIIDKFTTRNEIIIEGNSLRYAPQIIEPLPKARLP